MTPQTYMPTLPSTLGLNSCLFLLIVLYSHSLCDWIHGWEELEEVRQVRMIRLLLVVVEVGIRIGIAKGLQNLNSVIAIFGVFRSESVSLWLSLSLSLLPPRALSPQSVKFLSIYLSISPAWLSAFWLILRFQ